VVAAAAELCGFPLIVYGTIDENVHPQNSLQLVEALQKAGKSFAVMPYPENRHGVVEPAQRRHLYQTMAEFFLERL
jgi:dipeptidyl-peptidase-4